MDFELTEDQEDLKAGIRSLCEGRFPIETVRGLEGVGVDRALWGELAETGVFSLVTPEADGGVGLGYADAVLVFEELGRALVPGPLVGTLLAHGVVDGEVVGLIERPAGPTYVEYLDVLDTLLVLDHDGVWQVQVSGEPAPNPLDPLTPVSWVESVPQGERIAAPDAWRTRAAVLTSALQLGVATGATELAVAYAKERQQFGKPIGQFQAVKHICADMYSHTEVARAAVYMAGVTLDDPGVGDPERAAAAARIVAVEAAAQTGKDCVQVHGGMGFTWEVDAQLYLKRAWALTPAFGSVDEHAEALAAAL